MARKTVDELTKENLTALDKETEDAYGVKKTTVKSNIDTYNQEVDAGVQKAKNVYQDRIADVERAEKSQYDDNYIDELVARKNLENSMADMGLTDSGLNRGQLTSISVMRGNADARARQTAVDSVRALKDAIDQAIITGEQKKTAYQQEQSAALSEWYQNQLLANKQNARTNAVAQYNAETEAIEKQQEAIRKQTETMIKNGYVQQGDSWVKDDTAERTTYAMTLIKNGTPEDEAWASAYCRYPTSDEKTNLYYAAYKDGVSRGYTGDALKAYANAGGGAAGKAAVNQIMYSEYDNELRAAGVDPEKQSKFHSPLGINDWSSNEAAAINAAWVGNFGKSYNQSQWDKSIKRTVEQAKKNINKTSLSAEAKEYAVAVSVGRTLARVIEGRVAEAKNVMSEDEAATMMYNALGSVLSDDMLQVAAEVAGLTVED